MEILSEEAIGVINGYLQAHENKTQAEEEKASAINELVNATINNAELNNLFEVCNLEGHYHQGVVFPRNDVKICEKYINPNVLKDNRLSDIRLSLGIPDKYPISPENIQGDGFGFYLSTYVNANYPSFTGHLPDRVQKIYSYYPNEILLKPEEVVPVLKAIIMNETYVFELPNPDVFGDGLEKSVGKAINYITGS